MKIDANTFTETDFRLFIASHTWTYAKTMPKHPHEYTLRKKCKSETVFEQAVVFIREHGYMKRWGGRAYMYFDVGEWQYWTMGAPIPETILINRAKIPTAAPVEAPATIPPLPTEGTETESTSSGAITADNFPWVI